MNSWNEVIDSRKRGQDHEDGGGGGDDALRQQHAQDVADEHTLANARITLAHIEPASNGKRSRAWLWPRRVRPLHPLLHGTEKAASPRPATKTTTAKQRGASAWAGVLRRLLTLLSFVDTLYILVSVPLRVGFFFDPIAVHEDAWTDALTIFSAFDLMGECVRLLQLWLSVRESVWDAVRRLSRKRLHSLRTRLRQTFRVTPQQLNSNASFVRRASQSEREELSAAQTVSLSVLTSIFSSAAAVSKREALWFIVNVLPLEAVLYGVGRYNWMHVAGIGRLYIALRQVSPLYRDSVLQPFRSSKLVRNLSFVTVALVAQLFWTGLYLCHVSAAGYMFLAHYECGIDFSLCPKAPVPGCWVLKDSLEHGSAWRQYVRTMYWASKTVTTLGQGDLVPATILETQYCIVVQFISGLWATAFLSACNFYFSRRDANMATTATTRQAQTTKFAISRKLPKALTVHVASYFQYMQRTRNGIEEDVILADLPTRYRIQCAHHLKAKLLLRMPFFRSNQGAFLRTILDHLIHDMFSPGQVLMEVQEPEEMFLVSSGEIRVADTNRMLLRRLLPGNSYGERALFRIFLSPNCLIAESFCEIWWLPRRSFEHALQSYFSPAKLQMLMAQHTRAGSFTASSPLSQGSVGASEDRTRTRDAALKKFMTKVSEDSAQVLKGVARWRFPSSKMRVQWRRLECLCLLILAIEVPFQIAFQRGFEVFSTTTPEPMPSYGDKSHPFINFGLSIVVEWFFYADWVLRAFLFVRSTSDAHALDLVSSRTSRKEAVQLHAHELIVEKRRIFWHYIENESFGLDLLANLPVGLAWDLLPKALVGATGVFWGRYLRVLRLVRLRRLVPALKTNMHDWSLAPATQLLLYVSVGCALLAHFMGCIFFMLADHDGKVDGLPVNFTDDVISDQCLEHASLYGNCTWYMYDHSTFNISSPFIRSMHWSLVLLSTVGYGDILSFSDSECLLGFWWIYVGALLCYFTAGAISSYASQRSVLSAIRNDRLEEISRTLAALKALSPATKTLVRRYYLTYWKVNSSATTETNIRRHLPRSLQRAIARVLYTQQMQQCSVFVDGIDDDVLLRELSETMTTEIFLKGMCVVGRGHVAQEFCIVQNGAVELLYLDQTAPVQPHPRRSIGHVLRTRFSLKSLAQLGSGSSGRTSGARGAAAQGSSIDNLPLAVVGKRECFGEESLLPEGLNVYAMSARALVTTHILIFQRHVFLNLIQRFPAQCEHVLGNVQTKLQAEQKLFKTIERNFRQRKKLLRVLYASHHGRDGVQSHLSQHHHIGSHVVDSIIDPTSAFAVTWRALTNIILLYNFYQVLFRVAFLPRPSAAMRIILTSIDIACDVVLYVDMILKWRFLGYLEYGEKVLDREAVRQRYVNGWFRVDCISMLPLYLPGDEMHRMVARLPRLLKSPQLLEFFADVEEYIQQRYLGNSTTFLSVFDIFKFLLFFLSAAHQLGSLYFILGRAQHEAGVTSWMSVDPILNAYDGDIGVQYLRSVYWCLETFTVVCFGDVLAHNVPETLFASATCILGWILIGQVIGKMTALMLDVDKDNAEHLERVTAFEDYAKRHSLPASLKTRAHESLEYKTKSLLLLNAAGVFEDLPRSLRLVLFDEVYGTYVREIPEFHGILSHAHVQAICSALVLEIYLRHDVIYREGRPGTKLMIMHEGRGELFAAHSEMVLAAVHEGVVFGDLAFFLPGARHLTSARAHQSCQVLQLSRAAWKQLWPDRVRLQLEHQIVPVMKRKYGLLTATFRNIVKNFELMKKRQGVLSNNPRALVAGKLQQMLLGVRRALQRPLRREGGRSSTRSLRFLSQRMSIRRVSVSPRSRRSGREATPITVESTWNRHLKNLRLLRFLDDKLDEAEHALQQPLGRSQAKSSTLDISTREKRWRRRASLAALPKQGQWEAIASGSSASSMNSARTDTSAWGRHTRHSIQLTTKELQQQFLRLSLDDSTEKKATDGAGVDARSAMSRTASLQRGKSLGFFSLVSPHSRRSRSNSLHSHHRMLSSLGLTMVHKHDGEAPVDDPDAQGRAMTEPPRRHYDIWLEPPAPPSFCLENSTFRHWWHVVMLTISLYYVLVMPFRVSYAFEFLTTPANAPLVHAWFAVEYVMDAFCVLDFIFHRSYFTFIHRGELVTNSAHIRDHYFHDGTYVTDLISILPFELLIPAMPFLKTKIDPVLWSWYRISVFRFTKLLRAVHLHDLSRKVQSFIEYDLAVPRASAAMVYFSRFSFVFALGAHWLACLYYAVAFNTFEEDGRDSWLTAAGMLTFEGITTGIPGIAAVSVLTKYTRSYHFSMGDITTVSYGDIAPRNAWETSVTVVVIVASMMLFGMLSGGWFNLIELELGQRADYEERVAHVAHYMIFHRFQAPVWRQMQVYFAVNWQENKGMNQDDLLRGITTSLRKDITLHVKRSFVRQMPLFASCEEAFMRAMFSSLQQELFVRHDIIIAEGDLDRSLYIIETGLVSVRILKKPQQQQQLRARPVQVRVDDHPTEFEVLKGPREFLGEKSLLFGVPRSATCVALCACSVLILTHEKYEEILEEFPEYREKNMREWMFTRGGFRPQNRSYIQQRHDHHAH
ncbi:TPA: hypothetical protein N0F65_010391 [Lagenidium giganteum]|uniref:Cyclic nucleotide-binding domain-containing protein n=1 Tax=Lagenidium giganteum TaxID=4803 RepID=A0AAV2YXE2_9STRA|nr:TPA: hypothetical protein N0F65_010391 [Lagenidium giganteum]